MEGDLHINSGKSRPHWECAEWMEVCQTGRLSQRDHHVQWWVETKYSGRLESGSWDWNERENEERTYKRQAQGKKFVNRIAITILHKDVLSMISVCCRVGHMFLVHHTNQHHAQGHQLESTSNDWNRETYSTDWAVNNQMQRNFQH